MKSIISFIFFVGWIAGIVLAKGFWSTTIAVIIPLWSWYLVIEQLLVKFIL
jgi:hypothetical protein